jgi:hypothetical protein
MNITQEQPLVMKFDTYSKHHDIIEWLKYNVEGKYSVLEVRTWRVDIKIGFGINETPITRKVLAIRFTDIKAATLFKLFWEDIIDYDVEIVE